MGEIIARAPEDGRNYHPKHVELIGIINKPLLLHPFGCLYYCISDARWNKHQIYKRQTGERNSLIQWHQKKTVQNYCSCMI